MNEFELRILDWIQVHLSNSFNDFIWPKISALGSVGIIWICLCVILLMIPKYRTYGIGMAISLVIELICCNLILKPLAARTRPFDVNPAIHLLVKAPTDYSFPSGHTGASFAAAGFLWFSKNRLWIPSMIIAAFISFSRMYLYVHYPTDVIAGVVLGLGAGWAGFYISKKMTQRFGS